MAYPLRRVLVEVGMGTDILSCVLALFVVSRVHPYALLYLAASPAHATGRHLLFLVFLVMGWHILLAITGAYHSYRIGRFVEQAAALARGAVLCSIWTALSLWLIQDDNTVTITAVALHGLIFLAVLYGCLVSTRSLTRLATHAFRRRGRNLRNLLIVGSNRRAVAVADRLLDEPELGFQLAGFVDDSWHFDGAPQKYKQQLIGSSRDFLDILRRSAVDNVVIALPLASQYALSENIIRWCSQQGIPVHSDGSLFETDAVVSPYTRPEPELIAHHRSTRSEWARGCKRMIDIVVSSTALVALLPVLAAISAGVKLTSKGPVLFRQERLGRNKRRFLVWKFRTMVPDAERLMAQVEHLNQSQGPTFKLNNDPRVTKFGQFLRRTSLDELPQLVNVLLGDMSLVGPRPLPLRDYDGFSADWHRRRFTVKPGLTCLWQIVGRSSVGFDRWMELDMDYIDRWSLWLDFEILIKTIPAVLRGTGAM